MENLSRSIVGSERQTEWSNTLVKLETYRYTNYFTKLEHSMKKFIYIVAVSFLSVAFMGSSFAGVQEKQQQLLEKQAELNQAVQKESVERTQEYNKSMQQVSRASKIIGTKVKNSKGESLGDIKDLVMDPENGQVVYGVVSFGGILGMGDKLFAIPWGALVWNFDKKYYILDLDKETLKKAPGFDKKHWPDSSDKWERLREELNQFPFYHPKG
jgi:sporulation protein YlmC with PRC-barrel domain